MFKQPFPFENRMSRGATMAGLVYFPIHVFLLPFILPKILMGAGLQDEGTINLIYYTISACVMLVIYFSFLREHYDVLLDRLGFCIISLFLALGLDYVLSYGANTLVFAIAGGGENPNDAAISEIVLQSSGAIRAAGIFLAPIVEELLFRGVVFGALREKNRGAAYAMSMLMFALYHVWPYAAVGGDWTLIVYVLQYLPVSFVLCWIYERCGSIWMPIGFHMLINAMSFAAQNILEQAM